MKKIKFTKMQGSGNDFVVMDGLSSPGHGPGTKFVSNICDRKFGVGADGVLLLSKSKKADARMRIFNADGSEAQMCGNGARCAALYISRKATRRPGGKKKIKLETMAGLIEAEVKGEAVKVKLGDPKDLKLDIGIQVHGKSYVADYIDTGVPHAVIEVDDLENIPVMEIGRAIRHHEVFAPAGTNVDFIHMRDTRSLTVRTYERGVEDETLACGTGSVAGAIVAVLNHGQRGATRTAHRVSVTTRSGEVLTVTFTVTKYQIFDVQLEGAAQIVFEGEYHV